jgi:dTDP-6-deoxy-L-talose 4-dehydrogenase (NAD+)
MTRVLVTGGTGFIGKHVVNELLSRGYEVVVATTKREFTEAPRSAVKYLLFDLSDLDEKFNYFAYFDSPDHLIHLAWEGLPDYRSSFHIEVNLPRHVAFLRNMLENGLKDLTVSGTCLEYGLQEGELDELMDTRPTTPYGQAKDKLRRIVQGWQDIYSFTFRWVRLFYIYGAGQHYKSLLSQLDRAISAGEPVFNMSAGDQLRDFLPVESAAEFIVDIAMQDRVSGVINCCSGTPVSVRDFVVGYLARKNRSIELNLGFYPYPEYEPKRFWGSNKRLKKIVQHE